MSFVSSNQKKSICFVASARDYHAIDWYRAVKQLCPDRRVFVATDSVESEGVQRLIVESDEIVFLFPLDKYLFSSQSFLGDFWRNLVKALALPFSAYRLKKLEKRENVIFHAHSMYYIFLCWLSRVEFIGTPMGSDVLVRPDHSFIYRVGTILSLRRAGVITVDSVALQKKIFSLTGRCSDLIQNGIDTRSATEVCKLGLERDLFVSVRGMYPNYRILELLEARKNSKSEVTIDFLFPFYEDSYLKTVRTHFIPGDKEYGRLSKVEMFRLLGQASVVFSLPASDSSPRSVYEAVFCGAAVVSSYGEWFEFLPSCMRARVIIVDLNEDRWFDAAIERAKKISSTQFKPSDEAIRIFDEIESMKWVCKKYYNVCSNG